MSRQNRKTFSSIFLFLLTFLLSGMPLAGATTQVQDQPRLPTVNAEAFILFDAGTETVLLGKDYEKVLAPASITKVLTVLLALERLELADQITITSEMFAGIPNDYTRLGLVEGEIISVADAIAASLLISANDAALALGLAMGETETGFAKMMNDRAKELGCTRTNFTNPYGYADPEHVTTALDMALITKAALAEPLFRQISLEKNMLVQPTNKTADVRGLPNGNRFIKTTQFAYAPYIGGKTGFTNLSGHTIVAGAEKDGLQLIGVILDSVNAVQRYEDLINLFEYGFANYRTEKLNPADFIRAKDSALSQLEEQLQGDGLPFLVGEATLELPDHTTITADCAGQSCQARAELGKLDLAGKTGQQEIRLALQLVYANGFTAPAGFLQVELLPRPEPAQTTTTTGGNVQETAGAPAGQNQDQAPSEPGQENSYVRYLMIFGLVIVFFIAIMVLVAMIRRDLVKKKRKRPRLI